MHDMDQMIKKTISLVSKGVIRVSPSEKIINMRIAQRTTYV